MNNKISPFINSLNATGYYVYQQIYIYIYIYIFLCHYLHNVNLQHWVSHSDLLHLKQYYFRLQSVAVKLKSLLSFNCVYYEACPESKDTSRVGR